MSLWGWLSRKREAEEKRPTKTALFIDYDNIVSSLIRWKSDEEEPGELFGSLMNRARVLGELVIAEAYADFSRVPESVLRGMHTYGIKLVLVPKFYGVDGSPKDFVDENIVVNIEQTLNDLPEVGIFILASGDGHFIPMANRLKNRRKRLILLVGEIESVSIDLRKIADEVISFIFDPSLYTKPIADIFQAGSPEIIKTLYGQLSKENARIIQIFIEIIKEINTVLTRKIKPPFQYMLDHLQTAGIESKFGITKTDCGEMLSLLTKSGILKRHKGSREDGKECAYYLLEGSSPFVTYALDLK